MAVDFGPNLGFLINADIGEQYYDAFRPFLAAFDTLVQPRAINVGTNTPPSSPSNGDTYVVGSTPTGSWSGQQNSIAVWSTEVTTPGTNTKVPQWVFYAAKLGMQIWNVAASQFTTFTSSGWQNLLFNVPALNAENNWTALQNFEDGFASSAAISVFTPTPATSLENQNSPVSSMVGTYWDGTTSRSDIWSWQVQPSVGTNPTVSLTLTPVGSSGNHEVNFSCDVFGNSFNADNGDFSDTLIAGNSTVLNALDLVNNVPATSTFNAPAAPLTFQSSYWNGTGSVPEQWEFTVNLGTGTNPTSTLALTHTSASGSAIQFTVPSLTASGTVQGNTLIGTAEVIANGPLAVNAQSFFNGNINIQASNATSVSGNIAAPSTDIVNQYWNGSSSEPDSWSIVPTIGTGTTPTSTLTLSHTGSSGTAQFHIPSLNLDSAVTASTAATGSATLPANPVGFWEMNLNGTIVKVPYYAT